jgi:hypothetical protein
MATVSSVLKGAHMLALNPFRTADTYGGCLFRNKLQTVVNQYFDCFLRQNVGTAKVLPHDSDLVVECQTIQLCISDEIEVQLAIAMENLMLIRLSSDVLCITWPNALGVRDMHTSDVYASVVFRYCHTDAQQLVRREHQQQLIPFRSTHRNLFLHQRPLDCTY